ncbi:hypothetical protein GCM10020220_036600 [Nonomuraea rubra]
MLAQAGGAHDVEGAVLAELRRAVLTALPDGRVVVDAAARGRPEELVRGQPGHDRVGLAVEHLAHRRGKVVGVDERAGGLHQHDDLRVLAEGVERVQHRRLAGGGRAAQLRRALHHDRARLPGGLGDPVVVGADHDLVHQLGAQAGPHRPGDQRDAPDQGEVLQGYARRTSAGGNNGQDSQGVSPQCIGLHPEARGPD